MRRIIAVVSVFDTPELLPFLCDHYIQLGVDKVLVAANCEFDASPIMNRHSDAVAIQQIGFTHFSERNKVTGEEQLLAKENLHPDDWILHLDLDEFQQYPIALRDVCAIAEARDIWAVKGHLLDRVTPDGMMRHIEPNRPLDQQYTHSALLTDHLVAGQTAKVMLARRKVRIKGGRHGAHNAKLNRWPVGMPQQYRVHHFRWHGSLLDRLRRRWSHVREGGWTQSNLQFVAEYDRVGKIDLSEPRYRLRQAGQLRFPSRSPAMSLLMHNRASRSVNDRELDCLMQIVRSEKVESVLEFGPGRSTAAFAAAGCQVDSLESDPQYTDARREQLRHDLINIYPFEMGYPIRTNAPDRNYDLGFIDGPPSRLYDFIPRLDCLTYAASRCKKILLHNTRREEDQRSVMYLQQLGWQVDQQRDEGSGLTLMSHKSSA